MNLGHLPSPTPAGAATARRLVALLALAVFINYVDRGNLATAAPLIVQDLALSNTQIGFIISAFFWVYAPCQLLAGWLADRFSVHAVLAVGLALWGCATMLTGLAAGFASLFALRLLLGLGECVVFPCSSKLLALHTPAAQLGRANSYVVLGIAFGPACGTLAGGVLMAQLGWRTVFVLFGLLSLLWLWPWISLMRRNSPRAPSSAAQGAPTFAAILRRRSAWGACLGHLAATYSSYFVVSWLPLYLVRERGLSVTRMAALGAVVYVINGMSSLVTGWASDRWIAAGASHTRARKTVMIVGQLGAAVCLLACADASGGLVVPCLALAGVFFGMQTPTVYAIGQTLAGPRGAGKWIGLQNFVGNFSGIAGPIITGVIVDRLGSFYWAFALTAAVSACGILAWALIMGPVEPLDWSVPAGAPVVAGSRP